MDEPDGVGGGKETLGPEQRASRIPRRNLDAVPDLLLGALGQRRCRCFHSRGGSTSKPTYVIHGPKEE